MNDYNNELMHYGVLGMKWGKRKAKSSSSKTAKKKYVSNNKLDIQLYGQKGANRIKKRTQEKKMSHRKAENREIVRQALTKAAVTTAVTVGYLAARNPKLMGQTVAAVAGKTTGKAYGKVVNSFGGYSYKNAAKYVSMNLKNKARGVTYRPHKSSVRATKFLT